ncbi:MAG: endonuclease/exonuclease/phosphatase family protein [Deltaproteobacteria bacterium]|nr:endonuclease/exonuclease/phosphatase family protein [Deltaproteobacteria bacterium]
MIGRIETFLRESRRLFSRSEWLARLLKLPVSKGPASRPGLLMIQLDGLSRREFERALKSGEVPFMQRLIQREHYQVKTQYSGLPASTPAFQAELFYGVKNAVPAFTFNDPQLGRMIRMYEPEAASHFELLLANSGNQSLLTGGSVYAGNFTGGSEEAHFCPAAMGWGPSLRSANPFVVFLLLMSNLYSFLRTAVLLPLELVLALVDFARGLSRGYDFFKELKFVPTRVAICILLRELAVIGAKIDMARGLPIIHLNFLGYDEQAHRRGPSSQFAHWTLKGIDDAVKRLWRAAGRSKWRHYDIWIYSDHGQVQVEPYHQRQGQTIEEAVDAVFNQLNKTNKTVSEKFPETIQTQRVRLLGGRNFQRFFSRFHINVRETAEKRVSVAALGPVGFIYPPRELSAAESMFVAHELTRKYGIPVVIMKQAVGKLCACTAGGHFYLPDQAHELFAADHPFLGEIEQDLVALCQHPGAGSLTLLGWCNGAAAVSFAVENGAHAGITVEETEAFNLLPGDTVLPLRDYSYLRPIDLRRAALQYLGRDSEQSADIGKRYAKKPPGRLRIMTYNVHSCIGMDGKLAAERIARVIARANLDVVALQELDVGRERTNGMDQAQLIAHYLKMDFHFHAALHLQEERYGDAILTHLPLRLVKAGPLPTLDDKPQLEPRGALWVAIELHGMEIQIINTHLGLLSSERMAQVEALLGSDWLGGRNCRNPMILCGDFNARPSSPVYRRLSRQLKDVQREARQWRPRNTFSGRFPTARIDHIFTSSGLGVRSIEVPRSELTMIASDHLPLIADLCLLEGHSTLH